MVEPPAKFEMYGPCRAGGNHLIIADKSKRPFSGVACRICWKCKSLFFWVVSPPSEDDKESTK